MIKQWSEKNDRVFSEAVQAMSEDMDSGNSFEGALEHYASLFEISESALRHEWNLRKGDDR